MTASRIILLRHAEKPAEPDRGVDARGHPDGNELSVRGWQRAGALARLFSPGGGGLGVPDALFAERPCAAHPSRRCISTLQPLADRLGLTLDQRFQRGDETELAQALSGSDGLALVAWDHRNLARLAHALLGDTVAGPAEWSDSCFDKFWMLTRDGPGWRLEELPQGLLAGDDTP
jgi:hypothetical protein